MRIPLKYGCNPHQTPASLILPEPSPLRILNGNPSYINLLDALGAWQLVQELQRATGVPAAASFKHTSPAGAAIARPLSDAFLASQFLHREDLSLVAQAYVRAQGGDRMCSFGDVVGVRDRVDDRAHRSNVKYVAQMGSSLRDEEVTQAANEYGMVMVHTGLRCFSH